MELRDKVVVITGGGRGVGRPFVYGVFVSGDDDAHRVVADRDRDPGEAHCASDWCSTDHGRVAKHRRHACRGQSASSVHRVRSWRQHLRICAWLQDGGERVTCTCVII